MDRRELRIKYKFNDNMISDLVISNNASLLDIKLDVCMKEGFLNIDHYKITMWRDRKPTVFLESDDYKSLRELYIKNDDLFCIGLSGDWYKYPY
jgi:hypothetical protein